MDTSFNGLINDNNGFQYKIYLHKTDLKINIGDFVNLDLIVKNEFNTPIFNSYNNGMPIQIIVNKGVSNGDIMSALTKLCEGDSAVF